MLYNLVKYSGLDETYSNYNEAILNVSKYF